MTASATGEAVAGLGGVGEFGVYYNGTNGDYGYLGSVGVAGGVAVGVGVSVGGSESDPSIGSVHFQASGSLGYAAQTLTLSKGGNGNTQYGASGGFSFSPLPAGGYGSVNLNGVYKCGTL